MSEDAGLVKNRSEFWKSVDYRGNGEDDDSNGRKAWFAKVVAVYDPESVLELGCNEGSNLRRIGRRLPKTRISAIEINPEAASVAQESLKSARIITGSIYEAGDFFKEKEFDLVFTMGVAIHLPPEGVVTMKEQAIPLARRVIIHCEEQSRDPKPVRFDGQTPHRWTHDYLSLYGGMNPIYYPRIVGSADGAHHLIIILAPGVKLSLSQRIKLWYLCWVCPFVDTWVVRLRLRWRIRGWGGFLPGSRA